MITAIYGDTIAMSCHRDGLRYCVRSNMIRIHDHHAGAADLVKFIVGNLDILGFANPDADPCGRS